MILRLWPVIVATSWTAFFKDCLDKASSNKASIVSVLAASAFSSGPAINNTISPFGGPDAANSAASSDRGARFISSCNFVSSRVITANLSP